MPEVAQDAARSTPGGSTGPAVSVVVATFDRSNILPYTLDSVLRQTERDFELLVVGDGCADDTADVVARIGDPRIRFVDLRPRVGDQSGPTNAALALARGRFVALLNHDDFWFPDHLERALATLESTQADLTFALQLEADPGGQWRVNASFPDGRFDPILHPNASTWVFRRELAARVGVLRRRDRVHTYPTREWLWRAYRGGAAFAVTPAVTVLVVSATTRRNVYAERQWREHEAVWRAMRDDPTFRERRITEAWLHPRPTHLKIFGFGILVRALVQRASGRVAQALRIDPEVLYCYYKFPRRWGFLPERGAVIRELYRRRGLVDAPTSEATSPCAPCADPDSRTPR